MGIPSLFRPGLFCWNLINQSLKELNRNHQCGVFLVMTRWGVIMGALAICKSTPPFCFHSPLSAMEIEVCAAGFAAMGTLGIWA